MVMKFKAYHKIPQYHNVVKSIREYANFKGLDENGDAILEETEKPILEFVGTTKLHGSHANLHYNGDKLLAGKRTSLLPVDAHTAHFGFNFWVQVTQKDFLLRCMEQLYIKYCKEGEQITLYGEWAGPKIQKGVAISELPKSFYFFDCKVYNEEEDSQRWIDIRSLRVEIPNMYNIHQFPTRSVTIDFNDPEASRNEIKELTLQIERECPVASQLGVKGIGEGVVFTTYWKDRKYIFKSKGTKHSSSRVKTIAAVDPEVLKSRKEFVEYACTTNRIEQGIKENNCTEKKDIPKLLKWLANDIIEEEREALIASGLEWKQVAKAIATKARIHYFKKLEEL